MGEREADKLRVDLLMRSVIITAKEAKQLLGLKWTTRGTRRVRAPKGSTKRIRSLFRANRRAFLEDMKCADAD
jgi:hypothetical protein